MSPIANNFSRGLYLFNGKVIDYDCYNPGRQVADAARAGGSSGRPMSEEQAGWRIARLEIMDDAHRLR